MSQTVWLLPRTLMRHPATKYYKQMDNNIPVDAVYLDFAKAFDTVPHKRLLVKLEGYSVKGEILNWVKDFLSNGTQYVSVNGERSTDMPVWSSVTKEDMNLFADDAKAFNEIQIKKIMKIYKYVLML